MLSLSKLGSPLVLVCFTSKYVTAGIPFVKESLERFQTSEVKELAVTEFTLTGEGCPRGPKGCSLEIATQSEPCVERCTNQKLLGAMSQ